MADDGAPENRIASPGRHDRDVRERRIVETNLPDGAGSDEPGSWIRLAVVLLHLVPRNAISRWAGRVASLRLPGPLQRAEIRLFARLAGVDLEEAREPVEAYVSLQDFFTRRLRPEARPIQGDERSLVSPCDGVWGAAGRIRSGMLVQVKGRRYPVAELLGDADLASRYEGGFFATFYLSPRDYHRFHTPAAGRIRRLDYHPGSLWPVNAIGLHGIDRLFARNERICAYLEVDEDSGAERSPLPLVLVAVGAMMVGSVRLAFDDLRTNPRDRKALRRDLGERAPSFFRGQEWGHFEFGSTILLLTPPSRYEIDLQPLGSAVRMGEVIGRRLA